MASDDVWMTKISCAVRFDLVPGGGDPRLWVRDQAVPDGVLGVPGARYTAPRGTGLAGVMMGQQLDQAPHHASPRPTTPPVPPRPPLLSPVWTRPMTRPRTGLSSPGTKE